jgi:hypothetical protein
MHKVFIKEIDSQGGAGGIPTTKIFATTAFFTD